MAGTKNSSRFFPRCPWNPLSSCLPGSSPFPVPVHTDSRFMSMSTCLAAGPEGLDEALELLDAWDDGFMSFCTSPCTTGCSDSGEDAPESLSSGSSESAESPRETPLSKMWSSAVQPTQIRPRSDRQLQPATLTSTHHRRREEIKYLRTRVAEMQEELEQTLALRKKRKSTDSSGEPTDLDNTHSELWRSIAQRQLCLREAAETERTALRARVDAQMAIVRRMASLMHKARSLEDKVVQPPKRQRFGSAQYLLLGEVEQLQRVHGMHQSMDQIFAHSTFQDASSRVMDVRMIEDDHNQFIVQLSAAWTVPFDQHRVLDALWLCSHERYSSKWCSPQFALETDHRLSDNELITECNAVATLGSFRGNLIGRSTVKKFPLHGAMPSSIVTLLDSVPSASAPGDFAGVGNREESCLRIVPSDKQTGGMQCSRVQFSQRLVISFDDLLQSRHQAGIIASLMLNTMRKNVDLMHETVETVLLTRAQ